MALRLGIAPLAAKALGPGRLATWATKGVPFSKFLFRHGFGNSPGVLSQLGSMRGGSGALLDAAAVRKATGLPAAGTWNDLVEARSAFNPARFDWKNPQPATWDRPLSGAFNRFLTEPSKLPTTRLGHAALAGRYMANRAVNTGYRMKQFAGRYPNATLSLLATYPAAQGVLKDQLDDSVRARERAAIMPRWGENKGYYGMPVSSMVSSLVQGLGGGNTSQPFLSQVSR